MSNIYKQILMENVLDIIKKRGFYYIRTKVLYPDFVGPEYIIVTDDADIVKKHPKTAGMIIVPISKFESMAEEYNRYYANEVKHIRRIERSYNDEGYTEDGVEDENGETHSNLPDVNLHPVEEAVEAKERKAMLIKALEELTPIQRERLKKYYFQQMTYEEIARSENVGKMTAYRSIRAGINKIRKNNLVEF